MKWYNVHFDATKYDPKTYVRKVRIEQRLMAESAVDAVDRAIGATFGYGNVEARIFDEQANEWIPAEWFFMDEESPYGDWSFKLWIDEESAILADMVSELSPAEELRLMGAPTLFDVEANA